jgi:dipeptidyl aminopeptidase/acylaminoacyl peptidase
MRPQLSFLTLCASLCAFAPISHSQTAKPSITLDEFFNTTEITDARLSPDGSAAVIATETPDWKANNFRHDLWLWTAPSGLRPLTHSGSEENPQWSPDGKWIAFVSDRALSGESANDDGEPSSDADKADRLWVIPVSGGEALPLYRDWSRTPWVVS